MLSNPITLLNDSTEAMEANNGSTLTLESSGYLVQQNPSIAKSLSDVNMGLDEQDERPDAEDRDDDLYEEALSDEDQDMSDGGAALTMTLSHAEQLNAELDMLDAEVMGSENLAGLHMDNHYHPIMIEDGPFDYYGSMSVPEDLAQDSEVYDEEIMDDGLGSGPGDLSNLPVAMSAVSQQLQHIQDGQAHADFAAAANIQHGGFQDNSTSPLLFHSSLSANYGNTGTFAQLEYVSLEAITPPQQQQTATLGLSPAGHIWGTQGWAQGVLVSTQGHLNIAAHLPPPNLPLLEDNQVIDADDDPVDDQFNLSFAEFLYNWAHSSMREDDAKKRSRGPTLHAIEDQREMKITGPMTRKDLWGEKCDIQRIDWAELGVSRLEARQMRRQTYKNYTNLRFPLQWHPRLNGSRLTDDQDYFRFRRMDFDHPVHLSHFQLRNLISCASRDHIFYAGRSYVHHYTPGSPDASSIAMDLSNPTVQPLYAFPGGGVQISTLTIGQDILVAGGFSGEYGVANLRAPKETKHTEGIVTHHVNGITNHIQVYAPRNISSPVAAFASNDMSVRILDISTNRFLAEHKYQHAINCTALSPDKRLRVLVGDSRNVFICNSETGEILQELEGHRDFGFACDWADDGWTVATGNQDMQVKIWDARKWTTSSGIASPVATIAAEMAGVRKLKFSPIGSGRRLLVAAEPADFVSVIDAETFSSKQTLSFFGEIGGVDFTNDGQDLIVANCDNMRGGIMEFERCNLAAEASHGIDEDEDYAVGRHRTKRERNYDWKASNKEILSHPKSRGTEMHRTRRAATLGTNMGIF